MNDFSVLMMETLEKTENTWYYVEQLVNGDICFHELFKMNEKSNVWDCHVVNRIPKRLCASLQTTIRHFVGNGSLR